MPRAWYQHRRTVGSLGEAVAAEFLTRRGARVIARNLRVGRGELDLLVSFGARPAVVEVKTVAKGRDPAGTFTEAKATQVRTLAGLLDPPVRRVDLVTVTLAGDGATVRWTPNAA